MEHETDETGDAFAEGDYASFGARVVAFLIDLPILAGAAFVALVLLALVSGAAELHLEGFWMFVTWVVTSATWEAMWIAGPARGKPGQLMLGFRVLRPDGSRVSAGAAVVRSVVRFVTFVVFPFGLIAQVVTLAASERNQAVHDVFSGSVCVWRRAIEQTQSVQHVPMTAQRQAPSSPSPIERSGESHSRGPFL